MLGFLPCDLKYSFWIPVSCHSISWTPNQVIGAVEMGEGFMAEGRERTQVRPQQRLKGRDESTY